MFPLKAKYLGKNQSAVRSRTRNKVRSHIDREYIQTETIRIQIPANAFIDFYRSYLKVIVQTNNVLHIEMTEDGLAAFIKRIHFLDRANNLLCDINDYNRYYVMKSMFDSKHDIDARQDHY